jgi:hypothetical protein
MVLGCTELLASYDWPMPTSIGVPWKCPHEIDADDSVIARILRYLPQTQFRPQKRRRLPVCPGLGGQVTSKFKLKQVTNPLSCCHDGMPAIACRFYATLHESGMQVGRTRPVNGFWLQQRRSGGVSYGELVQLGATIVYQYLTSSFARPLTKDRRSVTLHAALVGQLCLPLTRSFAMLSCGQSSYCFCPFCQSLNPSMPNLLVDPTDTVPAFPPLPLCCHGRFDGISLPALTASYYSTVPFNLLATCC